MKQVRLHVLSLKALSGGGAQGEGEYLGTLWKIRVPLETPSHNWPINPEISLSQKMRREQRQCQHQ